MNNGGYTILDVSAVTVLVSTSTKAVVAGLYDAIEAATKPLLLSGLKVNDSDTVTEYKPCYISASVSSGNYIFSAYGYNFTVTDDDEIYYTASTTKSK